MAQGTGQVSSLSKSSSEALQGLLHSLDPEFHMDTANMTPEALQRLTTKISELVGDDVAKNLVQGNTGPELVNEEGLPILDINEPVDSAADDTTHVSTIDEPDLIPLHSLSASEREVKRRERDRFLDLLEAQEQLEFSRERDAAIERRQDLIEFKNQLKEQQAKDFKSQREMQKKMGKALLRNIAQSREREEAAAKAQALEDEQKALNKPSTSKKTVAFAPEVLDKASDHDEPQSAVDWGDVVPATLRKSQSDLPMKPIVVERKVRAVPHSPLPMRRTFDSDDESDGEDSDARKDGDEEELGDLEIEIDEEDLDFDEAQHQREIALEYYRQRDKIGQDALTALSSHSHAPNGDATHDHNAIPQSLGASVLPVSGADALQNSIRMGKLDEQERLLDDADSEEDEDVQNIINLLQQGKLQNLGPTLSEPSASAPINGPLKPLKPSSGISRFKLDRTQAGRPLPATIVPEQIPSQSTGAAPHSMVIESPSFPRPTPSLSTSSNPQPKTDHKPVSGRPTQPPVVMSASVIEKSKQTAPSPNTDVGDIKSKKVSRFMAERM